MGHEEADKAVRATLISDSVDEGAAIGRENGGDCGVKKADDGVKSDNLRDDVGIACKKPFRQKFA